MIPDIQDIYLDYDVDFIDPVFIAYHLPFLLNSTKTGDRKIKEPAQTFPLWLRTIYADFIANHCRCMINYSAIKDLGPIYRRTLEIDKGSFIELDKYRDNSDVVALYLKQKIQHTQTNKELNIILRFLFRSIHFWSSNAPKFTEGEGDIATRARPMIEFVQKNIKSDDMLSMHTLLSGIVERMLYGIESFSVRTKGRYFYNSMMHDGDGTNLLKGIVFSRIHYRGIMLPVQKKMHSSGINRYEDEQTFDSLYLSRGLQDNTWHRRTLRNDRGLISAMTPKWKSLMAEYAARQLVTINPDLFLQELSNERRLT